MSESKANPEPVKTEVAEASIKTKELKVEPGLLKLEDVPEDQRNEAVAEHLSLVNAKFRSEGREGETSFLRAHIKEKYGTLDLADLDDILVHADTLADWAAEKAKAKAKAKAKESETDESLSEQVTLDTVEAGATEEAGTEREETEEALEAQESPAERQARLQAFVTDHFPDCPPEFVAQAAGICLQYEDDYRDMFEEPGFKLSAEDAEDPETGETISSEISKFQQEATNAETISANETVITERETYLTGKETQVQQQKQELNETKSKAEAAEKKLPTLESELKNTKSDIREQKSDNASDRKELKDLTAKEQALSKAEDREEAKNETVSEDLKTVKELQSRFHSLKAERGTIGALKSLLGPDGVKSVEMRAVVNRVLGTAQSLVAALPGKAAVVERYLNQSSVDFSASAPVQTFAGFLSLVDKSDDFTEEERVQIRQILNSSAPPSAGSAAELKDVLKNGRGTKQITEIQRVEEPPGSGNFIEKEVVVGTETIPFTKSEPYVLSNNPLVKLHPVTEGGTKYQVNAIVTNASPINFTVDIPQDKPIPEQAINNQVNQHLLRATLQNANLRGVMDFWYGQGDSTFGAGGETSGASLGGNDMSKAITNMFLGQNTLQGNRFLTASELGRIAHDARWLVPGGDFGGTNKVAGAESNLMMKALFGEDKTEITENMARAHFVINSGGAEAPSFEGLYKAMYPEDTDFSRLTEIIGEQAVAGLNLDRPDDLPLAA